MALPRNTVLTSDKDEYTLLDTLGRGGFGIVYSALDKQQEHVAIKEYFPVTLAQRAADQMTVIPISNKKDSTKFFEEQKRRFFEEAEKMRRFKADPNIVNVYDCFEANDTAYFVMEFISGKTFEQVLNSVPGHKMKLKYVLKNLSPLIDVLERIHNTPVKDAQGKASVLIHRDISPDNIMFSDDGSIKLLDFGAARVVSSDGQFTLTNIGKKNYSPPEQFVGSGVAGLQGAWTDVYALAATIYRAITGKAAPHAQERESSLLHQKQDILKPPSQLGVEISPQQEAALLKGLELDYRKRYQSVREFFNDISKSDKKIDISKPVKEFDNKTVIEDKPQIEEHRDEKNSAGFLAKIGKSWAAAICSTAAALFGFYYMNTNEQNLKTASAQSQEVKKTLEKYDYLKNYYGQASADYYAQTPILFLETNGQAGRIPVYWSGWISQGDKAKVSRPAGIDVEWDKDIINKVSDVIVTPGSDSGVFTLHFDNNKNSDAFDVLIIVK